MVEIDGETEQKVAAEFIEESFGITSEVSDPGRMERITGYTIDHLELVRRSLLPAILIAIPLGVLAGLVASWTLLRSRPPWV